MLRKLMGTDIDVDIQDIRREHPRAEVIMEYVNKQNACCDRRRMSSAAGIIERVSDEGIKVGTDYVPFAGPCAAICAIRQVGNNKPIYENKYAYGAYRKKTPLTEKRMKTVKSKGRWVY